MKKRILSGQSTFDADGNITVPKKGKWDISIDELAEIRPAADMHKKQGNSAVMDSIRRSIERKRKELCLDKDETYNARLYNYPTGQHVTLYDNCIRKGSKRETLRRDYKNADRTEKEEEHCIAVSMARTKNNIYNIARSYPWKWFVTFTFDRKKTDASDFDLVVKRLKKNLDNTKQRVCPNLKYLIVPELHADKTNYHFHGLFADCDELDFIFSGKFDKNDRPIFNIPRWTWGWSTATLIGDTARASGYICKYVTKENERYLFGKRRYFSNVKKTEAEKLVVNTQDFIEMYSEDISYMKDYIIQSAHQHVRYLEMPYK